MTMPRLLLVQRLGVSLGLLVLLAVPAMAQGTESAEDTTGMPAASVALTASDIDTNYRLELHLVAGFGGTRYPEPPSPYSSRRFFVGYNLNARLMWHPDHLLSIGIMSGYRIFSRESFSAENHPDLEEDLTMELSSVPVHVAFEVRPLDIRFGASIGAYILLSQMKEQGEITHSWDVAYGGAAWLGYTFQVLPRLRVGPDVALEVLSDRGIASLSAMFTLQYDLIVY